MRLPWRFEPLDFALLYNPSCHPITSLRNDSVQTLLPHYLLSKIAALLANSEVRLLKQFFIRLFIYFFKVDLSEAERKTVNAYHSFNDFFTRALDPSARPFPSDPQTIISPVDGLLSQQGRLQAGQIIQAKNQNFSSLSLLGGTPNDADPFVSGDFITLYLSPKDYHRVHMPIEGHLTRMISIPGRLFSVNPKTLNKIDHLFARNERVVCLFETPVGKLAVVFVGAMIVGSISTRWAGVITPPHGLSTTKSWDYPEKPFFKRGEEIGHFCLGSTIVLLFEPNLIAWQNERGAAPYALKMGQPLGQVFPERTTAG